MKLNSRTIVVTGASGGIGAATAKLFAEEGASLILVGRDEAKLSSLCDSLSDSVSQHQWVAADLTTDAGRHAVAQKAKNAVALVNLAGINQLRLFTDTSDTDLLHMINSNLAVPMLLSKALLPQLRNKPEAWIINVGSIMGSIGIAGSVNYCASKFGLRGFTEALDRELADTSIHVCYVAPRATNTSMNNTAAVSLNQKLGNTVDDPILVARSILTALCAHKSSRHFLGWPEKVFVKLNALLPRLVDKAMFKQLPIIKTYSQQR